MIERVVLGRPYAGSCQVAADFAAHVAQNSPAPGMTFALPGGTPVLAAMAGQVIRCEWDGAGGRTMMVDHGERLVTLYDHLRAVWRVQGERVEAGETLGLSGDADNGAGAHLVFGVRANGRWVDPMDWFADG
jgi:murein DD-endopeptidase MepM/ murein hydrolase activator NlpD